MRLEGKVALVTDADSPFARQLAHAFAAEGADLFLQVFPKSEGKLDDVVGATQAACAPNKRVVAGAYDITHEVSVTEMTRRLVQEFDRVDVLVNMAAEGARGLFFDLTEQQWDRCLAVGLKSYFLTVKHVGKEMARRGTGKIINFSSIVSIQGAAGAAPWSAARGGVDAMTRAQAHALGPYGVSVNALVRWSEEVGAANTPEKRERLRRLAFGPAGKSSDGVGSALFLASADSDWVTGTVLYADGGYSVAGVTDAQYRPGGVDEVRAPSRYSGS